MGTNQVVVMPYPSRGHINPLLNLCRLLSSRSDDGNLTTVFTIVVTEDWHGIIGSDPMPDNVRFATIPNVIPLEANRGSDTVALSLAVQTEMETPFAQLLDRMELPVKFIIADVLLRWTFDVANRRNIPIAAYWPMSASMFILLYYGELLRKYRHDRPYVSGSEDEYVDYIPGLSPISLADLPRWPHVLHNITPHLHLLNRTAKSLLLTTMFELEGDAVNAITEKIRIPVHVIGPNIPHFLIQPNLPSNEPSYYLWLDSKSPGSVLYISLGSLVLVSSYQIDEILAGLNQSGVNFFWAAGGEASRLSGKCGSNGLVVEWCDQFRVLLHSSVGGFMSHCGWNSTKESLFSGVPLLNFPVTGDQLLNGKLIFEDWKNGWKLKTKPFVRRDVVEMVVRRFMDSENFLRMSLMEDVKELEDMCRKSVEEDGQANKEIDCFMRDLETRWFRDTGNI